MGHLVAVLLGCPPDPSFAAIPNKAVAALPDVTRADFQAYLSSISESFARFEDVRTHSSRETATDPAEIRGQGEALVACLREVPSLYFKEDFALEEGATFKAACPFTSALETGPLQEKLSHYLDTVEMHLVREIGLRSDSFFEAQGRLQGLDGEIVEACGRIRELKETIRLLDADLVGSARRVQELNATRASLVALQQKLTLILYVSQALSALQLLISAADCAGALDVTDDLQQLLDGDELAGLHCFRHLRDKLTMSLDAINSILSAEFMRASIHDAKNVDSAILSKLKSKTNNLSNGQSNEEMLDDEESTILRDRLLPLIIGLLRTAKFPAVLRIYRDALISDMKAAIKSTVAELLPVLVSRPLEFDITGGERAIDADGGGLSLANKLRSLSSESFVQLLIAIYMVVQAHLLRAAEVKRVIEWIMGNLDGCYAADAVAAAVTQGSAAASTAETIQENDGQLTSHLLYSLPKNASKVSSLHGKTNEVSSPNLSKNFRTDILRENTEAVFAACDTAHGRWAKLLGVRALLHPKLRLQEFLSIYNITQEFITATEKIGGRLGYSIRGTLQSQSKAFIDFQHESRMTKIRAVLDQETWVAVDVPDEFQGIAALLYSEALYNENLDTPGDPTSRYSDNNPAALSAQQAPRTNDSVETSTEHATLDTTSSGKNQENKAEVLPSSTLSNNVNDHGKSNPRMLSYRGVGYHMVNCGLILLKMLSEYVDISKSLPSLSSEVVHRVVEILKLFNTRTCQLVLGAGAMQLPVIIFFHGGGFILFSASTAFYDSSCALIARSVPAIVLSVDYRLAPESRLPSAYDDALDALLWLGDEGAQDPWLQEQGDLSRCFIMGSSSGGNIAYHAARRVFSGVRVDLGPVKVVGLILNQPFFGGVERTESETEDDDVLPLGATDMMWRLSLPVGADRDHEYCNPSREEAATKGDEHLLPRCLVRGHVGDPLINRQRAFVKLLKGRTEGLVAKMEEEGCHAVEIFDPELAKKFVSDIRDFVVSS
ncbi:putative carboxylesterase 8 [Acorus calamus]|uniref:Carboxylesterase 8 n=1 Tax=Acorus calamus TaxID=4465 RepID=A0AAV9ELX9_ACOCL|nr:putative carboxylesterase 8 [Acorus calamus]